VPQFDAEAAGPRRIARVLLDSALPQLDHLFDYAVPEELATELRVGHRVRVPFRSQTRQSYGYVIEFAERSEFAASLQAVAEIVSPVPQLTPEVWRLARAVADRAGGSAGDILRLAIPQRMVRVEKQHLQSALQPSVTTAFEPEPAEHELAELLVSGGRASITPSHGPVRLATGEWVGGWAERLARAALSVFAAGRSVILATPDYRDLEQLRDTFQALGHADIVRVDARQSNGERYANFLRALDTTPRIILGNRSAVYAPAYRLGALLLWDDGDPVLAEPLAPYVHARDAALIRAEQSGAGLLFAAHSRSAEVQRLIELGYVHEERFPPKRAKVVHADAAVAPDAFAGRLPEFATRTIRDGLQRGPVLVQVATSGYAPVSVCGACGTHARCRSCGGPIGFPRAGRGACRWCGASAEAWSCPECGGRELVQRGMGSQRTVEQFAKLFPGVRIVRSDGDHPVERVDSRRALVVATRGAEPIAAGGYTAVVLLDVERLLGLESLRAGEDCLRWWLNAAALAAPDARVLVASGGGPVVRAFVTGRVEEWLRQELRDRHALRYPPMVRVASVTGGGAEVERALRALGELPGVEVLGPAPAPQPRPGTPGTHSSGAPDGASGTAPLQRAIVRFEYAQGAEVAKRLRGALVADAAGSGSRVAGRRPGRAHPTALKLRFDDRGVFDG